MTLFKAKTPVKKPSAASSKETLHSKHLDMVRQFRGNGKLLAAKRALVADVDERLSELEGVERTPEAVAERLELADRRRALATEVQRLVDNAEEDEYYQKNADLIYSYFQNIDEIANQAAPAATGPDTVARKHAPDAGGRRTIIDLLKRPSADDVGDAVAAAEPVAKHGLNGFVTRKENFKRAKILDIYMSNIDPAHIISLDLVRDEPCCECGAEMCINQTEGFNECTQCGYSETVRIDSDKRSYKESANTEVAYCVYKRINHFREWISQFMARESTEIPQDVFDVIYSELRKNRITDLSKLTQQKVREFLKKNKLNRYYEHVSYIMSRLHSSCAPPTISKEDEERLCHAFKQIQGPFAESPHARKRKNFLSYSFVLYKLSQLFEMDHLTKYFQLLKSRDKLLNQELIWEDITTALNWQCLKCV